MNSKLENRNILNKYIYLINNLFIGKEAVFEKDRVYIFMGLKDEDIELPYKLTEELVYRIGLFEQNSGSYKCSSYVLLDSTKLRTWFDEQSRVTYSINTIDFDRFEPAIRQLRRIKNLYILLNK